MIRVVAAEHVFPAVVQVRFGIFRASDEESDVPLDEHRCGYQIIGRAEDEAVVVGTFFPRQLVFKLYRYMGVFLGIVDVENGHAIEPQ